MATSKTGQFPVSKGAVERPQSPQSHAGLPNPAFQGGPLLWWLDLVDRDLDFVCFVSLDVMHAAHHRPRMEVRMQIASRCCRNQKEPGRAATIRYSSPSSHSLILFSLFSHLLTDTHTHALYYQLRLKEDAPPDFLDLSAHPPS